VALRRKRSEAGRRDIWHGFKGGEEQVNEAPVLCYAAVHRQGHHGESIVIILAIPAAAVERESRRRRKGRSGTRRRGRRRRWRRWRGEMEKKKKDEGRGALRKRHEFIRDIQVLTGLLSRVMQPGVGALEL
jgi:hypothetical protein